MPFFHLAFDILKALLLEQAIMKESFNVLFCNNDGAFSFKCRRLPILLRKHGNGREEDSSASANSVFSRGQKINRNSNNRQNKKNERKRVVSSTQKQQQQQFFYKTDFSHFTMFLDFLFRNTHTPANHQDWVHICNPRQVDFHQSQDLTKY